MVRVMSTWGNHYCPEGYNEFSAGGYAVCECKADKKMHFPHPSLYGKAKCASYNGVLAQITDGGFQD